MGNECKKIKHLRIEVKDKEGKEIFNQLCDPHDYIVNADHFRIMNNDKIYYFSLSITNHKVSFLYEE
jgi:hypothetical protein